MVRAFTSYCITFETFRHFLDPCTALHCRLMQLSHRAFCCFFFCQLSVKLTSFLRVSKYRQTSSKFVNTSWLWRIRLGDKFEYIIMTKNSPGTKSWSRMLQRKLTIISLSVSYPLLTIDVCIPLASCQVTWSRQRFGFDQRETIILGNLWFVIISAAFI